MKLTSNLQNTFSDLDLTSEGARRFDEADPLREVRTQFHIPKTESGKDVVYLTGNSLGLQPKNTRSEVLEVLDDWQKYGVEGHFKAKKAWMPYHERLTASMAAVVGALTSEVVVMSSLTVNLHLLMASFYRPTSKRRKIVIEHHAFPSDRYAVRSQLAWHGFDPENDLIIAGRTKDQDLLSESEIESILESEGDEIALVLMGGVNYYSGQLFDMPRIVCAARKAGAVVGFDLAHAAGNVKLALHDWDVDFAAWCSYKYLNAGPGGPGAIFVHEKHGSDVSLPRFAGWWGHDAASRFTMPDSYVPTPGAQGWQLSNPPILSMAALNASLDVLARVGMRAIVKKSSSLTAYGIALLMAECHEHIQVITPQDPSRRGAQISIRVKPMGISSGKQVPEQLEEAGIICDWREPDVIRLAPVPLYNSFEDVYTFVQHLKQALSNPKQPARHSI